MSDILTQVCELMETPGTYEVNMVDVRAIEDLMDQDDTMLWQDQLTVEQLTALAWLQRHIRSMIPDEPEAQLCMFSGLLDVDGTVTATTTVNDDGAMVCAIGFSENDTEGENNDG